MPNETPLQTGNRANEVLRSAGFAGVELTTDPLHSSADPMGKPKKEPTVITSSQGEKVVQNSIIPELKQGQEAKQGSQASKQAQQQKKAEQQNQQPDFFEDGTITEEERQQMVKERETEIKDQTYVDAINNLNLSNTKQLRGQIATLQSQWNAARVAQEEANKFSGAAYKTSSIRVGQARYSPEESAEMLADVKSRGLQKLSRIDAQYSSAISQLESAIESSDYKAAAAIAEYSAGVREQARQEVNSQIEEAQKIASTAAEKARTASRDSAIAGLIEQGVTDPIQLLDYLNFDEGGTQVGDFSAEEVSSALTNLGREFNISGDEKSVADKFTGDTKNFFLMKENYPDALPTSVSSLPESEQLGAYIKYVEDAARVTTRSGGGSGGIGAGSGGALSFNWNEVPTDANLFTVQIGPKIYGGRISNDESERIENLANQGIAQGMTYAEIMDTVLGYKVSRNQPLADNLRNTLLTITDHEDGLLAFDMPGLARLIQDGKDTAALRRVENLVYQKARVEQSDIYMSESTVRYAAEKTDQVRSLLSQMGEESPVGVGRGTMESWLGRFRGKNAASVQAEVKSLVSEMRNRLSGSAVTPSEEQFLESLIPKLEDSPENFMVKLAQLESDPLLRLNNIRETYTLPRIDKAQLLNVDRRLPLYMQEGQLSDNDFFSAPLPTGSAAASAQYDPSVWGDVQSSSSQNQSRFTIPAPAGQSTL